MSENKNINEQVIEQVSTENEALTAREVWEQIVKLQDQLVDVATSMKAIHDIHVIHKEYEDSELVTEYDTDATRDKIKMVQSMYMARETTIQKMLDCYYGIYFNL